MIFAGGPITPIPAHGMLVFLTQLLVLLVSARVLGGAASRLGMPNIVGELLAGVLLGPSVLAHLAPGISHWLFPPQVEQQHLIDAVGQLGVLLLVGLAGMQLDLNQFRQRLPRAAKVSLAGLIVPLAIGVGIGYLAPTPLRPENTTPAVFAMFMGIAICVSAIPVIAKTLMELKLTHRDVGQLILTAGMFDDAVGWFLLSLVSAMATHGLRTATVLSSLGYLLGVVAFAVVIGRPLVRRVMRRVDGDGERAKVIPAVVILLFAAAAATQAMGLEAIFGAFLCGVLIGSSGVRLTALAPLNNVVMSVLAPIFFATAGLRMDLSALLTVPLLLAALGVVTMAVVGKFLGAYIGGASSGLSRRESIALGAGMNARGVIEVIIAMAGLRLGVLGTEAYTILILVAVVTSLMAPPILRWAMAGSEITSEEARRAQRTLALAHDESDSPPLPQREAG
ncbi:cation:proton antiporter [Nocardia pseudobrasiliensis]|uniref:Transporter (CPA2 family) n=1 Tax=Nocardia pseudobrasiliensis TaxID=45979 RepID=A0A370IBP8_9NOCA|nr:cation:proton antiporter [Nocardia pseudobrasiliensis]RDI68149.1 transporter (CPA2 family) [Nocardia pseudobrasiliensis]